MCRFMAFWGKNPVKLKNWLIESENSLLNQSKNDTTKRPNPDGWGFAYRQDNKFTLLKNIIPAFDDKHFTTTSQKLYCDLLFAHIRRKSIGEIRMENTHPFIHNNWIFMHNGNIPKFGEWKKSLYSHNSNKPNIVTGGNTDSEFLFKYFLYCMKKYDHCDVYCALNIIFNIINHVIEFTPAEDQPRLALNFLFTSGEYIIGFRRNRTLHYNLDSDGVFICSEPLDNRICWNEVPENHFIICSAPDEIRLAALDIELNRQEIDAL